MNAHDRSVLDTVTGPDALDEIQRRLDEVMSAHPEIPDGVRMELAIATAEIAANIVEHAAGGEPVPLHMEISALPNQVHITFTDHGRFTARIDLTALPPAQEMAERGRGLALAQEVLADLTYRRVGATNHWTLISKPY